MASCAAVRKGQIALGLVAVTLIAWTSGPVPAAQAVPTAQPSSADAALTALTATFIDAAAATHFTLAPGATCWAIGGPPKPRSAAVCGPVAAPDDPVDAHWQTATFGPSTESPPMLGPTGQWLADGTVLVGAHGLRRIVRHPGGDGRNVRAGQVAHLSDPGVPLAPPADGRVATFDQLLTVDGSALAHTAGPPTDRVSAGAGRHLLVVSVTSHPSSPNIGDVAGVDSTTATIVVDGQSQTLELGLFGSPPGGTATFAVSVATTKPQALLQLRQGGLTQTFDLIAGRRVEPTYGALYRDARSPWLDVTGPAQTVHVTSQYFGDAQDPISMHTIFGAFALTQRPPRPVTEPTTGALRVALMIPNGTGPTDEGVLDPSRVHIHVDAPTPTVGTPIPADGSLSPLSANFAVPADATRLTVTFDPGAVKSWQSRTNADTLTFPLDLPPAAPPGPTKAAPDTATLLAAESATIVASPPPASSLSRSSGRAPIGWIVTGVLLLIAFGLVAASRRRLQPADSTGAWDAVTAPAAAPHNPSPHPWPRADVAPEPPVAPTRSATPPSQSNGAGPVAVTSSAAEGPAAAGPGRLSRLLATITPDGRGLDGLFVVRVLGPIGADGWVVPTDRGALMALACWLAFHRDRPRSANDIVEALYPVDEGTISGKAETVRTNATRLRLAIGADRFPNASVNGGYQLISGVTTDLELFGDLVAYADTHPDDAVEFLEAAMDLVRGRPFDGVLSDPAFQWALAEGWEATAIEKVTQAAHRLAALHAERGDGRLALAALRKGLEISPDSTLLREDRIRLATDAADRRVAWREAVSALGAPEAERTFGSLYRRDDGAEA